MSSAVESVLATIESAFLNAPRPTNAVMRAEAGIDDSDIVALYPFRRWYDVPDDALAREGAALSRLGFEGFRYFLPAFLRYELRHLDAHRCLASSTLSSLAFRGRETSIERAVKGFLTPA